MTALRLNQFSDLLNLGQCLIGVAQGVCRVKVRTQGAMAEGRERGRHRRPAKLTFQSAPLQGETSRQVSELAQSFTKPLLRDPAFLEA